MRERLPDRRAHWTQKVRIENTPFYLCVGEYEDGRPAEIWINSHKFGTFARGALDALARSVSVSLQCGAPLEEIIKSLRELNFPPGGVVSGSPYVTRATSVPDWISQELEAAYLTPVVRSGA